MFVLSGYVRYVGRSSRYKYSVCHWSFPRSCGESLPSLPSSFPPSLPLLSSSPPLLKPGRESSESSVAQTTKSRNVGIRLEDRRNSGSSGCIFTFLWKLLRYFYFATVYRSRKM